MLSDRSFHPFTSKAELLEYMRQYKLIAPTKKNVPTLYYRHKNFCTTCQLIGYEENYDTFSISVIDYGEGPFFIHVDYLKDMQTSPERNKGKRLDVLPDNYIIIDTETTSRNVLDAELINIAAIRISNGKIVDTFSSLVKPNNPIPAKITKLTGITDLDVCYAPDTKTVLTSFLDYIGSDVIAGYNIASYDTTLLYDQIKSFFSIDFKNNFFDYYYFFRSNIPANEIENYQLSTVCTYLGIDNSQAHHALDDCMMCFNCYQAFTSQDSTSDEIKPENINCIDDSFEQAIVEMLNNIIITHELPEGSIYLYSNRSTSGKDNGKETSKSICIHEPEYPQNPNSKDPIGKNDIILNIKRKNDTSIEVTVKIKQFEMINQQFSLQAKRDQNKYHVSFPLDSLIILPFIKENVEYCIKHYQSSNTFSCCSQFIKCSDALKCVHENKLYSTGCAYRRNLENGRIFYGKNRNID